MAEAAPPSRTRDVARAVAGLCVLGLAVAMGGCVTDKGDVTGSIGKPASGPAAPGDARASASTWGDRYRANPSDKTAALNYARALRDMTQYQQANAVLEDAAVKNPSDSTILAAYGKSLSDVGRYKEASDVLARSQNPQNPDWRTLSAQGSVADQMGDHAQAQAYYTTALKIQPNDPGVMTNLGLSYALSSQLPLAETTIRQASQQPGADDMRVRQNLALVLALEGKDGEAEQVAQTDLPPDQARANVASIRAMIAHSETWRSIQRGGAPATGRFKARRLDAAIASR